MKDQDKNDSWGDGMDRKELKRKILEGMCRCAEAIAEYHAMGLGLSGIHFIGREVPEAFKPGTSDKMIFNQIIDGVIETIERDGINNTNWDIIGVSIMNLFYYPHYGTYRNGTEELHFHL